MCYGTRKVRKGQKVRICSYSPKCLNNEANFMYFEAVFRRLTVCTGSTQSARQGKPTKKDMKFAVRQALSGYENKF